MENNPAAQHKEGKREKENTNRHVYVEPGVQIDFVQDLKEKYDASQTDNTTHSKKILFWTKVSALLLFIYAALTLWQGHSAKRTADSAVIDQRPYVVVRNPGFSDPGLVVNQPLHAAVTVDNIGRTPAVNVYDIVDLKYMPAPPPVPGYFGGDADSITSFNDVRAKSKLANASPVTARTIIHVSERYNCQNVPSGTLWKTPSQRR